MTTVARATCELQPQPRSSGTTCSIQARVHAMRFEADQIVSLELRPLLSSDLPSFSAGTHIDLKLPNGLTRSYSLVNPWSETHRYVVAVNRDPSSRGGSAFIHDNLRVGDTLMISEPRNNFALNESADFTLMIAGGIGITPLFAMARRLTDIGQRWELHYRTRSRLRAAFLQPLTQLADQGCGSVHCHFDDERPKTRDIAEIIANAPMHTHLYCCGPTSMLDAFTAATFGRESSHVHIERFSAFTASAVDGGFDVVLARSGRTLRISAGQSILDAVLSEGIEASHSCREGVCGSCETRVLTGIPDHRDAVLGQSERESNQTMMICCSGCKGDRLSLDL